MTTNTNAAAKPPREQAEQAANAMLNVPKTRENLVARVEVPDYAAWRARLDAAPRNPAAPAAVSGLKLFRNTDDDSLLILADAPDPGEARDWARGGWKAAVPAQGVEGSPVFYLGVEAGTPPASAGPLKVVAHFKLTDYDLWHRLFLQMEGSRVSGGVTDSKIFRGTEDRNDVLVLADIADAERARAWLVEDQMTGYPAATGVDQGTFRFVAELGAENGS
jgi:hypothetical protein